MSNLQWESVTLGDVTTESRKRAGDDSGYQARSVYGVDRSVGLTSVAKYAASSLERYKILEHGMFAYNPMRLNIGSIGYCSKDTQPGLVSPDYVVFECNSESLDPDFLSFYINSPDWKEWTANAGVGSVRMRIYYKELARLPLWLPPLPEQRSIVEILGTLDDKIELNRRMNRTLESMAQAVFHQWFVDDEDVEDWDTGRLDDLLVLQRGFDLPTPQRIPGKYPVVAASGLSGTHNEYKVKGPGVTTGRSGVIGQVYFVHEDFWPLNTSLWIKEFKLAKPAFAYYLLKTLDLAIFNAGSAVPTLNRNHIHNLPLPMPSTELIERFENFAMPLLDKVHANENEIRTLSSLRDTLLPKLMRGEVRVALRDVEKEL